MSSEDDRSEIEDWGNGDRKRETKKENLFLLCLMFSLFVFKEHLHAPCFSRHSSVY